MWQQFIRQGYPSKATAPVTLLLQDQAYIIISHSRNQLDFYDSWYQ